MKTGILLSACMIVRNEERNLERCLKSIKKLVDEIVVVDTGSTDGTVKIAKRFGARVHYHEWQNDFSLHRNQSIGYARGKWVMVIDADEEFVLEPEASFGQIRDFLKKMDGKYAASAITFKDMQKGANVLQFSTTRFFRKGFVEYKGIVHNQPELKISDAQAVFCSGAHIKHYGYDLTPEEKEAKFNRTSALLMKQIETGQTEDMLPYFYLCQLYADIRNHQEAVVWAEKYWENRDKIAEGRFCDSIFFTTTKQYMKLGDSVKAKEWLERGIEALPGDLDMALAALEYGVWVKDCDLQIQAAKDFLVIYQMYGKDPSLRKNRFVYAMRPEALAYVFFHQTVAEIQDGVKAMMNLMKLLQGLDPAFREGMMQELEEELAKSNIPIRFHREKEATDIESSAEGKNFVEGTIH